MVDRVRTPEGARRYNLPIGAPIVKAKKLTKSARKARAMARLNGTAPAAGSQHPVSVRTAKAALGDLKGRLKTTKHRGDVKIRKNAVKTALLRSQVMDGSTPWDPENAYEKRGEHVDKVMRDLVSAGKSTDKLHARQVAAPGGGTRNLYSTDRAKIHREIIDELWKRGGGDTVPRERRALFTGGAGGSGKGFVLKTAGIKEGKDYVTVNADDVKEIMAERGLIPVPDGFAPMEGVSLVHEESSDVATMFAERLQREGVNMIWDITMGKPSQVVNRLDNLKANGYEEIRGMYVDVPIEVSVENAKSRYANGMDRLKDGKSSMGGRRVPPQVILESASDTPGITKNRQAFDAVRDRFTVAERWDNNRQDENGTKLPPIRVD